METSILMLAQIQMENVVDQSASNAIEQSYQDAQKCASDILYQA